MLYTNEEIEKKREKQGGIRKKLIILVYILIVPLLIYNVTLIVQAVINPGKTPSFFGIKTYVIISGSMQPELQIGDIVIVKEAEQSELKVGDIISFRENQTVITHRISEIIPTDATVEYKTKGDNNNAEDEKNVRYGFVEGKVIGKIPFLGNITLKLQGKVVIIFVVIITYIYIYYVIERKNKKKERRRKRLEYEKTKEED